MRLPWRPVSPLPAASTDLRYTMTAMTAVMNSVIQNAFQTPTGPMARRCRDNDEQVPEQRDDEGPGSLPKPLQCARGCDRNSGYNKTGADDAQGCLSCQDCFRVIREQSNQLPGRCQACHGSQKHYDTAHTQCHIVYFLNPSVFPSAKIITDKGAHSLDNPIGREIKERL